MNGIITHYNTEKRYGFISTEADDDIFFHVTRMKNRQLIPEVGMRVSFNAADSSKMEGKKEATDIVVLIGNSKFLHLGDLRIKFSNIKAYGISKDTSYADGVDTYSSAIASNLQAIKDYQNEIDNLRNQGNHLEETIENKARSKHPHPMAPEPSKKMIEGARQRLREENYHTFQHYESRIKEYEKQIQEAKRNVEELKKNKRAYENSEEYRLSVGNRLEYLYITTYQGDNLTFYSHNAGFDICEKRNEIDEYFA